MAGANGHCVLSFWSLGLGFDLQGFGDDGGDNNHQFAVAEVIVAANLLPEVGDAATGVYFLGPALGGDLLQIQRLNSAGNRPFAGQAAHLLGEQVFGGVV